MAVFAARAQIRILHRSLLLNRIAIDDIGCFGRVTAKTFLGAVLARFASTPVRKPVFLFKQSLKKKCNRKQLLTD